MNPGDWEKLKDWFGRSIEGTPDEALRAMDEAQRESPEMAARLRSLLDGHDSGNFMTGSAAAAFAPALQQQAAAAPGDQVGPYRILRELGRGGTGIVFLAERADDEFHRLVALKLLRYLVWDSRHQEMLTRERRALSLLRHPNIASLLDWGATEDGIPWLAMEYVDGLPIDEHCRAHCSQAAPQPVTALDLFEQVCSAVQYAHRHLIVHGDLKPQNILVTEGGVVKLLDFGISRLMNTEHTATMAGRFTPAYASPEQLEDRPIGVATDVYGLGLILYELLTGAPRFSGGSIESVLRHVMEARPQPPSESPALTPAQRRVLRGDLDCIAMHALEKDPDRRYQSAEHMLADLRRYREGYPIQARRAGALRTGVKFVQRNFATVSAAVLAVVALVIGAGLAIWNERQAQAARIAAETRFRDLQHLAHSVIFDLHDEVRRVPGTTQARRLLVATGLRYLDSLRASGGGDDALQMELAAGYYRMAYAQGGVVGMNLGDSAGGRRSYAQALRILDEQWRRHPGDPNIGALRDAVAFNSALSRNDPAEGIALATGYSREADEWARRDPSSASLHAAGLLHQTLGRIRRNSGELDLSLAELDLALDDFRRLDRFATDAILKTMARAEVERTEVFHMIALTQTARALTLLDAGRLDESLAALEECRSSEQRALDVDPGSPSGVRVMTVLHGYRSIVLLEMGRRSQAVAEARMELREARNALARDGSNAMAQRDVSQAERHLGNALGDVALLDSASREIARSGDADPAFLLNRVLQAGTLNEYGLALARSGQRERAREVFAQALGTATEVLKQAPSWTDALREKAVAEARLGNEQCEADWAALSARSPLRRRTGDLHRCAR